MRALSPSLVIGLGALAYFAAAELGLALATINKLASPVWPASGLAVALICRYGVKAWPAISIGALAANALSSGIATAIPIAAGNTIEGVLGGIVLLRLMEKRGDRGLSDRLRLMRRERRPQPAIATTRVVRNTIWPRFTESLR